MNQSEYRIAAQSEAHSLSLTVNSTPAGSFLAVNALHAGITSSVAAGVLM